VRHDGLAGEDLVHAEDGAQSSYALAKSGSLLFRYFCRRMSISISFPVSESRNFQNVHPLVCGYGLPGCPSLSHAAAWLCDVESQLRRKDPTGDASAVALTVANALDDWRANIGDD
jgi:hypothetical protein